MQALRSGRAGEARPQCSPRSSRRVVDAETVSLLLFMIGYDGVVCASARRGGRHAFCCDCLDDVPSSVSLRRDAEGLPLLASWHSRPDHHLRRVRVSCVSRYPGTAAPHYSWWLPSLFASFCSLCCTVAVAVAAFLVRLLPFLEWARERMLRVGRSTSLLDRSASYKLCFSC
jgi:hypothetical protein